MLTILTVKAISLIEFVAWLQRGGPNAWVGTTVANNNKRARRNAALNPHQTPAVTASERAPTVTASSISTLQLPLELTMTIAASVCGSN